MHQLTIFHCRFCQELIPIGRIDRIYCSRACKQKAYRWRNRIDRYSKEIELKVAMIAEYLDYEDTRQSALGKLVEVRDGCTNEARKHGVIIKAAK